jgi:hypothetical protein
MSATERTSLGFEEEDSYNLGVLAESEDRTKVDELRFLVKRRLEELGLKWKKLSKEVSAK